MLLIFLQKLTLQNADTRAAVGLNYAPLTYTFMEFDLFFEFKSFVNNYYNQIIRAFVRFQRTNSIFLLRPEVSQSL